jgi:galactose mutarotase-like enzyme
MDTKNLPTQRDINGLRGLVLENSKVRVLILPDAGAKIWQITYLPLHADILWNNPSTAPAAHPLYTSYDDNWAGGWDELFPNDEACEFRGLQLPDHGELWTGRWTVEQCDANAIRMSYLTPLTHFKAQKEVILHEGAAVVEVRYKLTNGGSDAFPFLWKLHPAFAVSAGHRIDFPAMTVVREPAFAGTLEGAPLEFAWPYAQIGDKTADLRQVPDASSGAVHFFYGTGYTEGWCAVTDRARKLAAGLRFDPGVFSSNWLFATHGGWKDLNVAVLEPATGYPFQLQAMIDRGQGRTLEPGESLETTVLFAMQEGLNSVGGVEADGTILPAMES